MTPTEELRKRLDELGIEWWNETDPEPQRETVADIGDEIAIYHENVDESIGYSTHNKHGLTPKQAIAATVSGYDIIRLWHEWEQVLFANVSDEVAQDNLNECVHELLDKAVTVGNVGYGIQFADWCEFPPETMVGDTVFDGEGNAIGWIVNATVDETCRLVDNESGPNMHCTECGREVDDEYRYFMESYGYSRCPHCGRRIEVSDDNCS